MNTTFDTNNHVVFNNVIENHRSLESLENDEITKFIKAYGRNYRLFLFLYVLYFFVVSVLSLFISIASFYAGSIDDVDTIKALTIAVGIAGIVDGFVQTLSNGFEVQTRKSMFHQGRIDFQDLKNELSNDKGMIHSSMEPPHVKDENLNNLATSYSQDCMKIRKRVGYKPLI